MATSPPIITALPLAPDPNDRGTFNTRAYPWSVALSGFTDEANALGANVFSNAQEAVEGAAVSSAQAQAAIAAINSPKWVTSTNYSAGAAVWSPTNGRTYRAKVALNPSNTDPALDAANWWDLGSLLFPPTSTISINTTAVGGEDFLITAGLVLTLPATPPDGTRISFFSLAASGAVTVDPNGATIRGAAGIMTLNVLYATANLRYVSSSSNWV